MGASPMSAHFICHRSAHEPGGGHHLEAIMSMLLMSTKFLKAEIEKLSERALDDNEKLLKSLYEKELAVLERLDIELVDITGTPDEVKKRLGNNAVYFLPKGEFEQMRDKANRFDFIQSFCDMSEWIGETT